MFHVKRLTQSATEKVQIILDICVAIHFTFKMDT